VIRHERQIKEKELLVDILENAAVCRIAISSQGAPYIVPMNYGFTWIDSLDIFFHCAGAGRKLDLLSVNNHVGFEIDCGHELLQSEKPCDWSMRYKSIIGSGKITVITGDNEKKTAIDTIMRHYKFKSPQIIYDDAALKRTRVLQLSVCEFCGKQKK